MSSFAAWVHSILDEWLGTPSDGTKNSGVAQSVERLPVKQGVVGSSPTLGATRLKHRGCVSECIRYIGNTPLAHFPIMKSSEWRFPDGSRPAVCSLMCVRCPDCQQMLGISSSVLEVM